MLNRRTASFTAAVFLVLGAGALACNIPVFRYALERWPADALKLLVFHRAPLTEPQQRTLEFLRKRTAREQGHANFAIQMVDTAQPLEPAIAELWKSLGVAGNDAASLDEPKAVLIGKHARGEFPYWHGELDEFSAALRGSPILSELQERLLQGHSVVWVVLSGNDQQETRRVIKMLAERQRKLEGELELPEGIGLPGSELFSDVPLFLRFSTIELDRKSQEEVLLLSLASSLQPEAFERGESIVMPVFGRGRVLEAMSASQMSERLVDEMTAFLCGACSCQVKEQNPGFDLLMDVDWEQGLFGDGGERPPASAEGLGQQANRPPVLLNIPPGRKQ